MPLVRTEIQLPAVIAIMKSRGYGDHRDGRYALAFNKKHPTERWKMTGEPKREPVGGGVSKVQLSHILTHSETAEEAADRVEAVILGREMLPMETADQAAPAPVMDTAILDKMVVNRTDSQIGRHLEPICDVLAKLTDRLEAIEKKLEQPQAEPKKKQRYWSRKKKEKPEAAPAPDFDFGPRAPAEAPQ